MTTDTASYWESYFKTQTDTRLKQVTTAANNDTFTINGKTYQYHKITTRQYWELEKMRAQFTNTKEADALGEMLAKLYQKCAEYYLFMSEDDYFNSNWEDMKIIIDACAHRTLYGRPFLSSNSPTFSGSEEKSQGSTTKSP
jgi:hypothetical protein